MLPLASPLTAALPTNAVFKSTPALRRPPSLTKALPNLSIPRLNLKLRDAEPFALPVTVAFVSIPAMLKVLVPVRPSAIVNNFAKSKLKITSLSGFKLTLPRRLDAINCPSMLTVTVPILLIPFDT